MNRYKIGFININGIVGKADALSRIMKEKAVDLLFISETQLRLTENSVFKRPIFDQRRENELGRRGQEGIMLISKHHVRKHLTLVYTSLRLCIVMLNDIYFCFIYFPPSMPDTEIIPMLDKIQEKVPEGSSILLFGDIKCIILSVTCFQFFLFHVLSWLKI